MKETNLTQEPASEIGGGVQVASPEVRAAIAKERVMAVYRSGVNPTYESFISRRDDGVMCACVIGSLAVQMGSNIIAAKQATMERAVDDAGVRTALTNQICQATGDFSPGDLLALEEGFMGWPHGIFSSHWDRNEQATLAFYETGKEIAKEVGGQV
jgi:hypothetical protein